ncbi:MAG: GNAT family N-acetyltransferase, partial [Clostridiales bacterium]|nr:GNAT family N-acetyltransferase [Clostridiales bacterium]
MLDFLIRPVTIDDAQDINSIRRMDGVRENTMSLFSERYTKSEDFIESLGDSDHMLVAVIKEDGVEKVIGAISLNVYKNLRANHCASVGIMVHRDYQGMGVGTALFRKVLDLADNWLMLIRVELTVYTENSGAVRLYRSLGFEIEGIKRFSAKRYGRYADEYIMARYNRLMINVAEIAYTAANAGSMSPEVYKQVTGSGGIEANGLKSRPDGGIEIETENSAENCSG